MLSLDFSHSDTLPTLAGPPQRSKNRLQTALLREESRAGLGQATLIVVAFQKVGRFLFHLLLNHSVNAQTDDRGRDILLSIQTLFHQLRDLLANLLIWWHPIHDVRVSFRLSERPFHFTSLLPHTAFLSRIMRSIPTINCRPGLALGKNPPPHCTRALSRRRSRECRRPIVVSQPFLIWSLVPVPSTAGYARPNRTVR